MKHPTREEYVLLLGGEATPAAARALRRHLQECPECSAEFSSWQRVIDSLPAWRVPESRRSPLALFSGVPRTWAWAAAFVMSATLIAGWFFVSQARQLSELRARLAMLERTPVRHGGQAPSGQSARVSSEIARLDDRLARLALLCSQATNDAGRAMAAAEEVNRANREALAGLAAAEKTARDQTLLDWAALMRESESSQARGLALLRQDLETVASVADDQIQLTRQNIVQIAAVAKNKL